MKLTCYNCGYEWPEIATAEFIAERKPILECPVVCPSCNTMIYEIPRPNWLLSHSSKGRRIGRPPSGEISPNGTLRYSRATTYGLRGRHGTILCEIDQRPAVGQGFDGKYYCAFHMRKKYGFIPSEV